MDDLLNPLKSSFSPEVFNDKEKQKRIHTWLGEQTTNYFNPASAVVNQNVSPIHSLQNHFHESINSLDNHLNGSNLRAANFSHSLTPHLLLPNNKQSNRVQSNLLSRPTEDQNDAATKIQALWKGYCARTKNPCVIEIRREIRARRAEQYITTLCNEVILLKQKQKAERKLRELQTEAIRFMWSEICKIQGKFDIKITDLETKISEAKSTEEASSQLSKDNTSIEEEFEKEHLKDTVEKLQAQVVQLQDALLSFSDRLVTEGEELAQTINMDEEDDKHELYEGCTNDKFSNSANAVISNSLSPLPVSSNENLEIFSARDNVSKITVQNILDTLDAALTEKELWSLCEQAAISLKSLKNINITHLSPSTVYVRKDGLVSFSKANLSIDTTYCAPEITNEKQKSSVKSMIFSLAVTLWSAADFNMTENQAPCLSSSFENLLIKMSQDDTSDRACVNEVLKICAEHHSCTKSNSLQTCASLYAETCDLNKGKKRKNKSISFSELFSKEIEKTRCNFQSDVVPQLNTVCIKLKPASDRQLLPKPKQEKSMYDCFLDDIKSGLTLKRQQQPKLYSVQDMFKDNPELIQRLNILPGQRRKNMKAIKSAMKNMTPRDGKHMFPSAPQSLKAEIKCHSSSFDKTFSSKSLVLRWNPSFVYDKLENKTKSSGVIGYRIYVNRQPKGMVNGIKCRALLDGLKRSGEYRIYVCAVSALGESDPSNTVIANLETEYIATFPASPKCSKLPNASDTPKVCSTVLNSPTSYGDEDPTKENVDVVERVLQRYGIKKSSTYDPLAPISHTTKQQQNLEFVPKTSILDFQKPIQNSFSLNRQIHSAFDSEYFSNDCATSTSSDDHITPRTKALLNQLKDELLG